MNAVTVSGSDLRQTGSNAALLILSMMMAVAAHRELDEGDVQVASSIIILPNGVPVGARLGSAEHELIHWLSGHRRADHLRDRAGRRIRARRPDK